ncbi:sulfate/molybdate ABC transporter ATP-binding protein [Sphingomonas arenae]|uniref:sulfate/molybdate ABC transporter ATP-binding protein n=1 Tax=Sphingomonas arenae TaxID=2812555 RepID=UPI001967F46F|nr:ATP-binding cassette domain-containing protein [Sphingomonas arenae]
MNLQPPATSASVTVKSVSKRFSSFPALNDVSLEIAPGEFMALLGPSGSGKTTLLRVIAGLEVPDAGQVLFGKRDVTRVPVAQRGVGFVFQHYALFGHMTVAENIAFGLTVMKRSDRPSRPRIAERVAELLALVQLDGYEKRFPSQLSGGQRQRIALARALARKPSILLLDEPFGALDAKVRRELRTALRKIHEEVGLTSVFVTHDHEEAFGLAERVTVLGSGVIEEVGTPEQLRASTNGFVRRFLE